MKNTKTILMPRIPVEILFQIKKRHRIAKNKKKHYSLKACKNFKNKKNNLEEMEG